MITMYTAVANRTVEIGTLRSLGFRRRSILNAFLIESMIIAMSGAIIGLFFASFLQFFTISTLNFQSFAETCLLICAFPLDNYFFADIRCIDGILRRLFAGCPCRQAKYCRCSESRVVLHSRTLPPPPADGAEAWW